MKLPDSTVNLFLISLLLILCVDFSQAGRHSKRKSRRYNDVHIEIYHPKGLMVWYPAKPGVVLFGIEINLNSESLTSCDVCLNTTENSYGKFILRDDDAIVRGGDHLEYKVIKQKTNGEAYVSKRDEFFVSESRIIPQPVGCPRSSEPNKPDNNITMLQQKVTVLERVVSDVFQHCNNITRSSKNLYLNLRPMDTRLDTKGLFNYTLSMLKDMMPSVDWDTVLIHAFFYDNGIAFEVKTFVDKLIVLEISKDFTQILISDLDDLDGATTDNEIELYDS
ncbi:uncharacterized protein LOC128743243 [Sabethes cyaneus]|uniref:uncharacterized protein LOC128743243 n=1 Tax=Sabethes cyaneus TaxID=53552 RepID=UPI00237DA578|nr:uncharacterized protein LOC128743243 [Sabethes cyaneus]